MVFYKIAEPSAVHNQYGVVFRFRGGVYNSIDQVALVLRGLTANFPTLQFVVFGSTNQDRLDSELEHFNNMERACAITPQALAQGYLFNEEAIKQIEHSIDQETGKYKKVEVAWTPQEKARLDFFRWMVQTGRMSEEIPEPVSE